jgi:hypothetical protein
MMPLSLIGLVIIATLIGVGAAVILKNLTFRKTTDRYRYVKVKDENGNEITKVIDLEDDEDARA